VETDSNGYEDEIKGLTHQKDHAKEIPSMVDMVLIHDCALLAWRDYALVARRE